MAITAPSSYLNALQAQLEEKLSSPQGPKSFLSSIHFGEFPLYAPFSFADQQEELTLMKRVADRIMTIFRTPLYKSDQQEVIIRSELSGPLSNESFRETMIDSKLWKRKREVMSPSEVHSLENTDSLLTYENKFLCFLVDCLKERIEDILASMLPLLPSFEGSVLSSSFSLGPYGTMQNYAYLDNIDGILETEGNEGQTSEIYEFAKKLKKKIDYLSNSEFYLIVHDPHFSAKVIPTNILIHHRDYSFCYRYYQKHVRSVANKKKEEAPYFNFVVIYILSYLIFNKSFAKRPSRPSFHLDNKGRLEFGPLVYHRGQFIYTLSVDAQNQMLHIEVLGFGRIKANYTLLISKEYNNTNHAQVELLRKNENAFNDAFYLLTSSNAIGDYDFVIPFTYFRKDNSSIIDSLFASFTLLFKADTSLYVRKCPVCGNEEIAEIGDGFICESCQSTYRLLPNKNSVWISGFRRKR